MALISSKSVIKYAVLVVLITVVAVMALYAAGVRTTPSSMQQVPIFERTQAATEATLAYMRAHPAPGNTGQHVQGSRGAQPPTAYPGTVTTALVPPQDPALALREMAPFSAPDGTKVLEENIGSQRVALAKPLPPPAARSNAPGAGTVEQAQKEYVEAMMQDPSSIQRVEKEWETKAFRQRTGKETGVYALMLEQARASGALPDPALKMDCRGIILLNLPQGHPCFKPYQDAIIAETPAIFVQ